MSPIKHQSFAPDGSYMRLLRLGANFFAAFAVLCLVMAVFDAIDDPENIGRLVFDLLLALFFVGFSYFSSRAVKQLENAAVSIDDDGVWLDRLGKTEGLVRWGEISSIKEQQYFQRLVLLGNVGELLIKLEYQLEQFDDLRQVVLAKTRQSSIDVESPAVFRRPAPYHAFNFVFIIGAGALAYYLSRSHLILGLLTFAVFAFAVAIEYLNSVAAITITERAIEIRYPLRVRSFDVSEIKSIQLNDQFEKGSRLPEVIVTCHTHQKPIRLQRLGIDASALYGLLSRWKSDTLFK